MKIPDSAQRERALDPGRSFIVQSPAGSGKTELLIQRYLALLGIVNKPEAVVAITFTRKAAGEMRRRVVTALLNSDKECPAEPHKARTWDLACRVREQSNARGWDLRNNPGRLRIQTIDSLCASLVRRMPWLSRLGGMPQIIEDAEELYREAARSTVGLVEADDWSADVGALLSHVDNNFQALEQLIAGMLAGRDQWLGHIASADFNNSRAALGRTLRNVARDAVADILKAVPKDKAAEIVFITAAAGVNLVRDNREGPARACVDLIELPGPDELDAWLGIMDTLLTQKGTWRKSVNANNGFPADDKPLKRRYARLIADLAENKALRSSLDELRYLPDMQFSETQWKLLGSMVNILPVAVEKLRDVFRARNAADFIEVSMAARRSMDDSGEPSTPDLGIDRRIEHILVDEFQDTSISQYSFLEALTSKWRSGDGRTIFAVGDPMQSIYRFREAEVGLFPKTCREGMGDIAMESIRLSANFRSDKGIVDWVNNSFLGVMPEGENITTGAIPFCASDPVHGPESYSAVTLHPYIGRDDEAEAARVVETVRSARGKGKKVAILVRARTHLTSILPALRNAGLRFRAVEIDPLAEVAVVRDLTALTRAMLHPADRVAWLALLRAPWCGLTLEELHTLAGDDPESAILDLARDESRVRLLADAGRRRLARIRLVLETALENRPVSLRSRVENAWHALGGPACTEKAAEAENAEAFFNLLDAMDDGGIIDPVAFERRIRELFARPDSEADDSLQIMSIHKAKGLEFDVVIVPGLGRPPKAEESRLMLWLQRPRLNEETDLLLAPIHATGAEEDKTYMYLKRVDSFKSEHESGRLLYVAATRAKSELHLFGHTGYGLKDDGFELKKPASGSLLRCMWAVAATAFQAALAEWKPPLEHEPPEKRRPPQVLRRLSPDWDLPDLPASVPWATEPVSADAGESAVSFHWVGDTLRHIGTVMHQALRQIANDGASQWDAYRIRRSRPSFVSALASLGVPSDELNGAANRVETALLQAIKAERGKWLLDKRENSACEYSMSGVLEGRIVNVRIDRTFVDDQGTRWIVDYKSSLHEGAGIEAFLDNECERYREQLARYRLLFGSVENRPVRTALYFPLLNAWREVE
ncbi:MAG: UvrD-helicase domain-containing protein [Acidobacteria bacterium]|nr:UvrD-helicase domain-containing protein [Acidobacteriota bacterium]